MTLPRLLLFTDAAVCAGRGRGVVASVAKAFAGVDVEGRVAVVVRAAAFAERAALTQALLPICRKASALVFAHDDAGLVGALGLDGVHLKAGTSVRAARLRLPRGRLLGRSLHTGEADDDACDYATLSPIFGAGSKPGDTRPALGVDALRGRARPTYALGGVDANNARACTAQGAQGVAVVSAVFGAVDPRRALQELLERLT